MTVGTATAFKSGNGMAIIIPQAIVKIQNIEAGNIVEIDITNTGHKRERQKGGFQKKKDQIPNGEAGGSWNAEA
jgi:antitoxin component of MazEF toxin-antitoxin module